MRLIFAAIVAADLAAIMIYPAEKPTFAQRWMAVDSINAGVKGDRLDKRAPVTVPASMLPISVKPRSNWLANPRIGTRVAGCTSFCEFP